MNISSIRFGFATNSSSTHSLVFLPQDKKVKDDMCGEGFGDFGWQNFTVISDEEKLHYLGILLRDELDQSLPETISDLVYKEWLGIPIKRERPHGYYEDDVDHQSRLDLPCEFGSTIPDARFFAELKTFLLQKNLAILGGNDNSDTEHPLATYGNFTLPIPRDSYRGKFTCRFDDEYNFWTIFNRETGFKVRMQFDNDPNKQKVNPTKASAPELIDLKITDYCNMGCPYCYQGSSDNGAHAKSYEILLLAQALKELKVFEVAIGGGEPTLHPNFVWILEHFRENGIVPNFTTNNLEWLRNPKLSRDIMNLAGAIGFSADDPEKIRTFRTLLDYNGFQDAMVNIHAVLGVVSDYSLYGLFSAASECHFDVTLLKYKNVGRGKNFKPQNYSRWLRCVSDFIKSKEHYLRIGIDTPLAEEYKEGLQKAEIPDYMYETKEGKFSCYIDAVEKKIGPSSYCDQEKMIKLDSHPATESLALQIYNAFKQF